MRDELGIAPRVLGFTQAVVRDGETIILDRVSLSIRSGSPTAVVGPNGSGKTTLLRLAMGLVEASAGAMATGAWPRAIVFQKPVMLRRSVGENVAFALRAAKRTADEQTIGNLLDQVGLSELADRPARRLSGGEQQRLGIARALACQPQLLLLDEATASLDPAQTKIVEDLIAAIARSGVKVVFSTHDLAQARRLAGDIVFLLEGRLAAHASTESFFTNPSSEAARRFIAGDLVF